MIPQESSYPPKQQALEKVREFKHTSPFELRGLTLGMTAYRILGLGWMPCLNNRMFFSTIRDLMAQRIEASNCFSCPMHHLKAVFCLLPPVVSGYKSIWKIKCRHTYSIHWNSILVLSYASVLLFSYVSSSSLLIFLFPMHLPWQVVYLSKMVPDIYWLLKSPAKPEVVVQWERFFLQDVAILLLSKKAITDGPCFILLRELHSRGVQCCSAPLP